MHLDLKFLIALIFCLIFFPLTMNSQDQNKLNRIQSFPSLLHETSGITTITDSPFIYCINDSGGKNSIYAFSPSTGRIEQEIQIKNATNTDWEDLTVKGNTIYIGDFGNNDNNRKDLKIYWVENIIDTLSHSIRMNAKTTSFSFEDQDKFPPKKSKRNFDVEAFIIKDNNFYLFTRNRSKDFDGTVKLYCVPAITGLQKAVLIDSFKSCDKKENCQITAASIDVTSGKIALLSANKIWILSDYSEHTFFDGTIKKIKLKHHSQKEAITFKDKTTLYIGEERAKKSSGNLYEFKLN